MDLSDEQLLKDVSEVEKLCGSFSRTEQIRIRKWIIKLREPTRNPQWKRTRNHYVRLLLKQMEGKRFMEPFDKLPKSEELPNLPLYLKAAASHEKVAHTSGSLFAGLQAQSTPSPRVTRMSASTGGEKASPSLLKEENDRLRGELAAERSRTSELVASFQHLQSYVKELEEALGRSHEGERDGVEGEHSADREDGELQERREVSRLPEREAEGEDEEGVDQLPTREKETQEKDLFTLTPSPPSSDEKAPHRPLREDESPQAGDTPEGEFSRGLHEIEEDAKRSSLESSSP